MRARAPFPLPVVVLLVLLAAAAAAAAVLACTTATPDLSAQTYNPYAQAAFGATSVLETPTEIGPTLNQRQAMEICNLGPNAIYCGFSSAASCAVSGLNFTNGRPVAAGACWAGAVSYNGARARLCCVTTVAQVAPANTRWNENY